MPSGNAGARPRSQGCPAPRAPHAKRAPSRPRRRSTSGVGPLPAQLPHACTTAQTRCWEAAIAAGPSAPKGPPRTRAIWPAGARTPAAHPTALAHRYPAPPLRVRSYRRESGPCSGGAASPGRRPRATLCSARPRVPRWALAHSGGRAERAAVSSNQHSRSGTGKAGSGRAWPRGHRAPRAAGSKRKKSRGGRGGRERARVHGACLAGGEGTVRQKPNGWVGGYLGEARAGRSSGAGAAASLDGSGLSRCWPCRFHHTDSACPAPPPASAAPPRPEGGRTGGGQGSREGWVRRRDGGQRQRRPEWGGYLPDPCCRQPPASNSQPAPTCAATSSENRSALFWSAKWLDCTKKSRTCCGGRGSAQTRAEGEGGRWDRGRVVASKR